ncbi:hypothetical protein K0M31_010075, partial [Melipona bicolor]
METYLLPVLRDVRSDQTLRYTANGRAAPLVPNLRSTAPATCLLHLPQDAESSGLLPAVSCPGLIRSPFRPASRSCARLLEEPAAAWDERMEIVSGDIQETPTTLPIPGSNLEIERRSLG